MKFDKLVPWNWFKREEEREESRVPVRRDWQTTWPEPLLNIHREIDRLFDEVARGFGFPVAR